MMFLTSLWTRRTFLEFEKMNVFDAFGISVIPLPCSRRSKCKKTNIAQCMLHEQQLTLLVFLCGKRVERLVQ